MTYTDEEMLDHLRTVTEDLGGIPKRREMKEREGPVCQTYAKHFGSWSEALEAAGVGSKTKHAYSDKLLLGLLRELAQRFGRPPTTTDMDELDGPASETYRRRFGSWNAALEAAGIDVNQRRPNYTEEELIDHLRTVAEDLGRTPTAPEIAERDGPTRRTYAYRFGSWNAAVEAAGLDVNRPNYTEEELIDHLRTVAEDLGRPPKQAEINERPGATATTYRNHFGSWKAALRAAALDWKGPTV